MLWMKVVNTFLDEQFDFISGICPKAVENENYPKLEHEQDLWCNDAQKEFAFPYVDSLDSEQLVHEPKNHSGINMCAPTKTLRGKVIRDGELQPCKSCLGRYYAILTV